jgi:hypothetical protein
MDPILHYDKPQKAIKLFKRDSGSDDLESFYYGTHNDKDIMHEGETTNFRQSGKYNRGFSVLGFDKTVPSRLAQQKILVARILEMLAQGGDNSVMADVDLNDVTDPDLESDTFGRYQYTDPEHGVVDLERDFPEEYQGREITVNKAYEFETAPELLYAKVRKAIEDAEITKDTMREIREMGYSPQVIQNIINLAKPNDRSSWWLSTGDDPVTIEQVQRFVANLAKKYNDTLSDLRMKNVISRRF